MSISVGLQPTQVGRQNEDYCLPVPRTGLVPKRWTPVRRGVRGTRVPPSRFQFWVQMTGRRPPGTSQAPPLSSVGSHPFRGTGSRPEKVDPGKAANREERDPGRWSGPSNCSRDVTGGSRDLNRRNPTIHDPSGRVTRPQPGRRRC